MAEAFDDPYTSPGFSYEDAQRPLDDAYRFHDYGLVSPAEDQMQGSRSPALPIFGITGSEPLISRHADSLSFGEWQRQHAETPGALFTNHDASLVQGLSMAGAMQALAERIRILFRGQNYDQGMDR